MLSKLGVQTQHGYPKKSNCHNGAFWQLLWNLLLRTSSGGGTGWWKNDTSYFW